MPSSAGARLLDDLGNPTPDCADASEVAQEATMFPSAPAGDISKRTLTSDEQRAICEIYPVAQDPMVCPRPGHFQPASPPPLAAWPARRTPRPDPSR